MGGTTHRPVNVSLEDAAKSLSVSVKTIHRRIAADTLPAHRCGRRAIPIKLGISKLPPAPSPEPGSDTLRGRDGGRSGSVGSRSPGASIKPLGARRPLQGRSTALQIERKWPQKTQIIGVDLARIWHETRSADLRLRLLAGQRPFCAAAQLSQAWNLGLWKRVAVLVADGAPLAPMVRAAPISAGGRQRQVRLRPEQVDLLIADYATGLTLVDLAKRYDVHEDTARKHLADRGITIRPKAKAVTDEQLPALLELRANGWSVQRLADHYTCSRRAIQYALQRAIRSNNAPKCPLNR